jgi:hypothetical protein
MTLTPSAARQASDRLNRALLTIASQGLRTHCSDPGIHDYWTSDSDAERAVAVMLCDHCPVLTVCRDTAELRQETWGVWGGKDFSRRPGRAKRLKQAGRDDDLFSVA